MTIKPITAKEYLGKKGIWFKEIDSNQLKTHCLFNDCDDDSKGDEALIGYKNDKPSCSDIDFNLLKGCDWNMTK